jgi:plastocyanin
MRARIVLASSLAASLATAFFACSNDDVQPLPVFNPDAGVTYFDAPADTRVTSDSAPADAPGDAPSDAADGAADVDAGLVVNECTEADFADADYTAADASRVIEFPFDASAPPAYVPPCMHIKAGESVTWHGDFAMHPLIRQNGDPGNPIPSGGIGDGGSEASYTASFPEAGVFGYACAVHAHMMGAIDVTP